jgi:ATP-dependent Clp protease adaptor protein ClpS
VADVGYIAIVVAGFGAYWWRHMRPRRQRVAVQELFTPEAEVALHVATHEATSRRQELSSLHVLYGLLQDETVTAAIATAGGNPDVLEDRVLAALDTPVDRARHEARDEARDEDREEARKDAQWIIGYAAAVAHHAGRRVSCTDLWAYLGQSQAAPLIDKTQLDRGATLFVLFHGCREPDVTLADERDVFIVLRNDHYTTQEFVCSILRDVFAVSEADASAIMMATHTTGRAVVGRFTAAAARKKIGEARALARAQAFPLWIGIEPA